MLSFLFNCSFIMHNHVVDDLPLGLLNSFNAYLKLQLADVDVSIWAILLNFFQKNFFFVILLFTFSVSFDIDSMILYNSWTSNYQSNSCTKLSLKLVCFILYVSVRSSELFRNIGEMYKLNSFVSKLMVISFFKSK